MKLRCTLSFFFSLGSFFYSSAQIPKDTIDMLQEITVSATKDAQRIVRLPYAITLGKRSLLSSPQARTVPEALQGFTGVFVQKTNHAGGSPFLRGLTGNQSLIMVDGIRLNNSIFRYGPNQYLTLVQPGVVDRIEIIKGTGAVQYGSDALTGVICMQSRPLQYSAQPTWNSTSRFRWTSSDMERSARREIYYSGKRVALLLGGGISNYGDLKGGDTTGVQQPSGYKDESFDVKLQLALGKEWELTASTQWFRQRNVPVYHKYVLEDFVLHKSNPIARTLSYIKLTKTLSSGFLRKASIIYSSQRMEETRFSRKRSAIATRREQDRVVTKGLSIDFSFQFTSFWRSNTGLDLYQDNVHSARSDLDFFGVPINRLRGLYPDGARYMNASAYSLHHLQFNRFTFETGIRQTVYHASLTEASVGKVLYTPKALVVQAGISYRLFSQLYGYAQISEGFRAANIDDLGTLGIVDFRYEVPAYGLKPERSLNQEVGIKYQSTHFAGTASVFRIKLFDLITRIKTAAVIAGYDVYTKVNVDEGYVKGYEADIRYFLSSSWKLQAGATYLFGQSTTRNEPLRRIPPFHTRVSLSYAKNRLEGIIHVDHAGKQTRLAQGDRDDNRIPFGGTPGFTVVHFQAGIRLKRIELQVMCHNLFNADYRLHGSGINGMGRAYSLSGLFSLYAQ